MHLLLRLLPFAILAIAQNTSPIVDLGYARYQGTFNATTNLSTFLSIRYADNPAGANRWLAPKAPPTVAGVQQATTLPPSCFQTGSGNALMSPFLNLGPKKRQTTPSQTEDCLFVDVTVPGQVNTRNKLPVIVWIHGGGYVAGNAGSFNGGDLVNDSNGQIIAVVIQYRLGIFGFLPGAKIKQGGVLNAGLLDQQFALQWVQQHISTFGGDPQRVTIWGESAGAGSVLQHIIANGGKTNPPLFQNVLTSSTFLPSQYLFNDPIPEALFSETVTQANCATSSDTLACLRALSSTTLQNINVAIAVAEFSGIFQWVPVVDGTLIRESPVAAIAAKRVNGKELLAVTNSNEGNVFVNPATTNGTLASYVKNTFPMLNDAQVNQVVVAYQTTTGLTTVNAQADLVQGESIFVCPSYYLEEAFGSHGHKAEFAVPPGLHGEDVAYYFTSRNAAGRSVNNTAFIQSFSKSFMDIIVNNDVNKKIGNQDITPRWDPWVQRNTEMLFNVTSDGTPMIQPITTDPKVLTRCALWQSLAPFTKQ